MSSIISFSGPPRIAIRAAFIICLIVEINKEV
jgi:hypothetical protein